MSSATEEKYETVVGENHRGRKYMPIDKGWAWAVVCGASGLFALATGGFKSQGVILVEVIERFPDYNPAQLLWVFSTSFFIAYIIGPLSSFLITKIGHRLVAFIGLLLCICAMFGMAFSTSLPMMICLYSVPAGFGQGFLVLDALLVSVPYFDKRKALALGIIGSGSGVGQLVLPNLLRVLFDNYGFTGAMILFNGVYIQSLCLACLFRPISFYKGSHTMDSIELTAQEKMQKEETRSMIDDQLGDETKTLCVESSSPDVGYADAMVVPADALSGSVTTSQPVEENKPTSKERFNIKVAIMPAMILFCISILIDILGIGMVFQGLPPLAEESGISKSVIALSIGAGGVLEIPCRILTGFIADKHIVSTYTQYIATMAIAGVTTLVGNLVKGLAGMIIIILGMATCGTSVFNLVPVVLREILGPEHVTSAMGIHMVYEGAAIITTTYLSGVIYNAYGSWQIMYFYISGCMITAALILIPHAVYLKCFKKSARAAD